MITFTAVSSFALWGEATPQTVDTSVESSPDFFSLLLAFFSSDAAQGAASPLEPATVSSNTLKFAKQTLAPPEPVAEDEPTEEGVTLSNSIPLAQPLLLTVVAPLLWEDGQTAAETPLTAQTTIQNLSSLLPAAPFALTAVNGEMNDLNLGHDGAEETLSNTALQTIPYKGGMVFTMRTTERGTPLHSSLLLDIDIERKPAEIFSHKLDPLTEGEQMHLPAATPGEQKPEIAKSVGIENSSFSATVDTGETQLVPTTLKGLRLPENAKVASPHSASASVEQQTAKSPLVVHNEQLFTEPSSHGRAREATQNSSHPLVSGSLIAPHLLGSTPMAALSSQPERAVYIGNVETWREVVNQVRDSIVTTVEQSNREAHLQLDPPELGKLAIQLVVEGERIHAHIVAESADVGALIQSHLPELKQALHSHCLELDTVRVDVQTGGGEPNTSSHHSQQEERANRYGRNLFLTQTDSQEPEPAHTTFPVSPSGVSVWA